MQVIKSKEEGLYEIKKSKFFCFVFPVFTEKEIEKNLEKIKIQHPSATHICFAYILSSPVREKYSDDGEPSGTAGKPMLELLKKKDLTNILLVAVRYFGGTKLGGGGLIRAYTHSCAEVLNKVEIDTYSKYNIYEMYVKMDFKENFKKIIFNTVGVKLLDTNYSLISKGKVGYKIAIKETLDEQLLSTLTFLDKENIIFIESKYFSG